MLKKVDENNKLLPLRKFAKAGLYSTSYLSQLVQRGKLKAKKIGRNYYTCELWFDQYLDRHARDEKYDGYKKVLTKKENIILPLDLNRNEKANYVLLANKKPQLKFKAVSYRTIAISMAIFIILLLANLYFIKFIRDSGQVAGVSEKNEERTTLFDDQATSSDESNKIIK